MDNLPEFKDATLHIEGRFDDRYVVRKDVTAYTGKCFVCNRKYTPTSRRIYWHRLIRRHNPAIFIKDAFVEFV